MLDDFLVRAAVAGVGIAVAAGPLGCFVVWRRMAYFGDATAHAALLGVALSLRLALSIYAGVLVVACGMAVFVERAFRPDLRDGHAARGRRAFGAGARPGRGRDDRHGRGSTSTPISSARSWPSAAATWR